MGGYRTYFCALLLGLNAAAGYLGWVTPEAAKALEGLLLGGGLAFLRAGVASK